MRCSAASNLLAETVRDAALWFAVVGFIRKHVLKGLAETREVYLFRKKKSEGQGWPGNLTLRLTEKAGTFQRVFTKAAIEG